jgi:hypothetical protein
MERRGNGVRGVGLGSRQARRDALLERDRKPRLRVGPLGGGDGTAAIAVAAIGAANYGLSVFCSQRILAVMNSLAEAASMGRSRGRERQWHKISHEREKQQQSGGQAAHAGLTMLEAYQLMDDESKNAGCTHPEPTSYVEERSEGKNGLAHVNASARRRRRW